MSRTNTVSPHGDHQSALVSENIIRDYRRDGAVVIRNVIPLEWIERMQGAIQRELDSPTATSVEYTPGENAGRYYGDFFVWRHNPDFREFALNSPAAILAQAVMQSRSVTFFYDHLLVKEKCTSEPTPLHQDLPYWPLRGEQIITVWVPFDSVDIDGGAVHYITRSHQWKRLFAPNAFSDDSGFSEIYEKAQMESIKPIEEKLDSYERLAWQTKPGDVIMHHPLTLHWAPGNQSRIERRRAIALRFVGDDAHYDSRPGTFMDNPKIRASLPPLTLKDGDRLSGELFPRIV